MKSVTEATTKEEKQPVKAKRGRKTQRNPDSKRFRKSYATETPTLPKVPGPPKITGSLGGTTTVYYKQAEGISLLRKTAFFSEEEWDAILAEKAKSKAPAVEIIRAAVREYLDL